MPFSTWSPAELADFLVAEGVADDISHEGLRILLREEGVSSLPATLHTDGHSPPTTPPAGLDQPDLVLDTTTAR